MYGYSRCEGCNRPRGQNVTPPGHAVMADHRRYTVASHRRSRPSLYFVASTNWRMELFISKPAPAAVIHSDHTKQRDRTRDEGS